MTAKEYLEQARFLDLRINTKIDEVRTLNELATKATMVYDDVPRSSNRNTSRMARTIEKIIDLENEINNDIDELVDLKREIIQVIKQVPVHEYQNVLERRYLHFEKWEKIAMDMALDLRWVYRMHGKALAEVEKNIGLFSNSPLKAIE